MAHPVDLFVDLAFLLDIRVRARNVSLGLVVIVIADEIFDGIVRKEALEFAVQLGGQGLVRGQNNRRTLRFGNDLGHGKCLARARRA